jgi:hypothetical protein
VAAHLGPWRWSALAADRADLTAFLKRESGR